MYVVKHSFPEWSDYCDSLYQYYDKVEIKINFLVCLCKVWKKDN